jgi:SepF-like predicted cell division protein (DUF552 family)
MSAFAINNEKNTDEVEILKQTIEILKKDLVKAKREIETLNQTIFEMNNDRAVEILEYFNRCGSIQKTAMKYNMAIEELYDMIPEWDGCNDGLQGADDYDECRKEIIGRQQWDEEQNAIKRTHIDSPEELDEIVKEYKSGEMGLYEIADYRDLDIKYFFKLLKELRMINKETDAKGYANFYVQYLGLGSEWDGEKTLNMIE